MGKRKRDPQWHIYDMQCDDDGSCALTAFLKNTRVHVVVDVDNFDRKSKLGAEYWNLVQEYKSEGKEVNSSDARQSDISGDKDSGVDVSADRTKSSNIQASNKAVDPEQALISWMLSPLFAHNTKGRRSKSSSNSKTLLDWYRCSTEFYELSISADEDSLLQATELEPTAELEKIVDDLLPSATLPKTTTEKIKVPHLLASDLQVLQCSDQPPGTPYHPCRVRHRQSKKTYFLKVVDNAQPRTTKRELEVLGRITSLQLNLQMRVPVLEGLVSFDDAKSTASGRRKIMGFLQTEIPNPTPLTNLLDPSIPQAKRDRWAKEAERLKTLLHDNDIVWGDAKADNFIVDREDNLWIIDFGGSYTEGWVDPELKETVEGDNQGTNKTINALKNPELYTYDSEDDKKESQAEKQGACAGGKRKFDNTDESERQGRNTQKRRRSSRLKKSR
jgi:hypothetical protein